MRTLLTQTFCLVCDTQKLYLAGNQIGNAGVSALASACADGALASLQMLIISRNNIGDAGATALANAVESNQALTYYTWSS